MLPLSDLLLQEKEIQDFEVNYKKINEELEKVVDELTEEKTKNVESEMKTAKLSQRSNR